jgi:hypothetical protein
MNTKLVESLVQVIQSLTLEEQALLEERLREITRREQKNPLPTPDERKEKNLAEYAGVIHLTVDPLEYQQRIRDEWS